MNVEEMDADDVVMALLDTPQPEDPYPLYHRLREIAPSHPSIMGMRFLSRYDDCLEALRSPSFHMAMVERMAKSDPRFDTSPYLQATEDMLIFTNPPQHTRLRGLVNRAFTPRTVERLRGRIQQLVDSHLDRIADLGEFDLVSEMADALPCQVVCELVGVPLDDQPQVARWTEDVAGTVSPVISDEALAFADKTIQEFHAYLRDLVKIRRAQPEDDLLSHLIAAEDQDHRLDSEELVSFVVTVLGAGSETTTNLISCGTLALFHHPEELAKLRADWGLMPNAVEELLRFEAPVQMAFPRLATEDTVIGGEEIVEGEVVAILLAAANHDPAVFPDPNELRLDRDMSKPPLAFGNGAHFCVGAALARVQGDIALRSLFIRFPALRVVDDAPPWRSSFNLRGVQQLRMATA